MNIFKKSFIRLLRLSSAGHQILNLYLMRKVLKRNGWLKSAETRRPVDENGMAIPWYTYSFLHFLSSRVKSDMRVFEYGSGQSTRWWATHASSVVSCEHDESWYQLLKDQLPTNVSIHHMPLSYGGAYSQFIKQFNSEFDVVVIDGRDRINCAMNAVQALKENGVLIWDNSDRESYREGMIYLTNQGFKQIQFYGIGPVSAAQWGTSIFYRSNNCFNI